MRRDAGFDFVHQVLGNMLYTHSFEGNGPTSDVNKEFLKAFVTKLSIKWSWYLFFVWDSNIGILNIGSQNYFTALQLLIW